MPLEKLSQFPLATVPLGTNDTVVGVPNSGIPPNVRYTPAQIGFGPLTLWTPTDQSGAGLVFTAISAFYQQIGNLVFVGGTLTYPATGNGSSATISLPIPVPNQPYAQTPGQAITGSIGSAIVRPVPNSSTLAVVDTTNSGLSGLQFRFSVFYPTS